MMNNFPEGCTRCGAKPIRHDALGMYWCEEHQHCGMVIDWGARHNWPELHFHPHAFINEAYHWQFSIAFGTEDLTWLAFGAVEEQESKGVA